MRKNNSNIKTLQTLEASRIKQIEEAVKHNYDYQESLTAELDVLEGDFDQHIVNKIVLWKVSRYAKLSDEAIALINKISKHDEILDKKTTRELLMILLPMRGMRLPMSSTILRFRNSKVYQILDHRVYRVIKGEELFFPEEIDGQIELYFNYLDELKKVCDKHSIQYTMADRTLYKVDKELLNKHISFGARRS